MPTPCWADICDGEDDDGCANPWANDPVGPAEPAACPAETEGLNRAAKKNKKKRERKKQKQKWKQQLLGQEGGPRFQCDAATQTEFVSYGFGAGPGPGASSADSGLANTGPTGPIHFDIHGATTFSSLSRMLDGPEWALLIEARGLGSPSSRYTVIIVIGVQRCFIHSILLSGRLLL